MIRLFLSLALGITCLTLNAQTPANNSASDLDHLYSILKKTPSYKDQIKGSRKNQYDALYRRLKADRTTAKSDLEEFSLLSQLLLPLKDNHLFFYQSGDPELRSKISDSLFVKNYRSSPQFAEYPRVSIDLDSLERSLRDQPRDSIQGIYHMGNYFKVGLYRSPQKDSLIAVTLESKNPLWNRGQIAFILKEHSPDRFRAFYSEIFQKTFRLVKNEKFQHRSLTESGWKKFPTERDHVNLAQGTPLYELKRIDSDIQYLRLGSFGTSTESLLRSQKFYDAVKDSLTSRNLIVDLRNNGGGGFKNSGKYLKLLKAYAKHGKIYALINNRTVSNAEQFTLKLKGIRNSTTFGETTNGTLTYGNNYGKSETLASGKFILYITDMKDDGHYLPYEEVGLVPDHYLDDSSDWIQQLTEIIKSHSSTGEISRK